MKKTKFLSLSIAVLITAAACKKNQETATYIKADKTEVHPGESVTVSLENPTTSSVAKWSVQPFDGTRIDKPITNGSTTITFARTGTYAVNAEIRTVHPDCHATAGWDTCFNTGSNSRNVGKTIVVK